jgi:hypothetical protein
LKNRPEKKTKNVDPSTPWQRNLKLSVPSATRKQKWTVTQQLNGREHDVKRGSKRLNDSTGRHELINSTS